jgi:phage shock protein PspC (stress-responsive transcriptional regulator)
MRKVTTINLNGRAYQLEEEGYAALQKYLRQAEAALEADPDKTDVLADIEQAIADKCTRLLHDGKNVVTSEELHGILEQMGPVEGDAIGGEHPKKADAKVPKRLFTIREGGMIFGVCKGIATYLNIEPNIVRAAFIILVLVTHGLGLLLYVALAIFLPHARTDADMAAATGRPTKAQDIIEQARERAGDPETMHNISNGIMRVCRIISRIIGIGFAILFGIFTCVWAWTLWQQVLGRLQFHQQLQVLNGWRETLAITLAYLIVALPAFLFFRVFERFGENRRQTRATTVSETTLAVLWFVSLFAMIMLVTTYAGSVRDYVNAHNGHLDIGSSHICVDGNRCGTDGPAFQRLRSYSSPAR